jgi:hypothetical protein
LNKVLIPIMSSIKSRYHGNAKLHATFILISPTEFTIQCLNINNSNESVAQSVIASFQLMSNVRFDWSSRPPQFVFPIPYHDQLHAILVKNHNMTISPLPSTILAVAREKTRQMNDAYKLSTMSGSDSNNNSNSKLYTDNIMNLRINLEEHIPENVLQQLAPFQKQGVEFILKNEGRALLADDMGLGKTRTSVAASVAYIVEWPVLVVCPSSARHNWQSELINMLVPVCLSKNDVLIVESANQNLHKGTTNTPISKDNKYKYVIVSYNLIQKLNKKIQNMNFGVIICDESHYLKNSKANRTKSLSPLIQNIKRAILISGTPALSRPMELFTQLNSLNPVAWPNEKEFGKRYCKSNSSISNVGNGNGSGSVATTPMVIEDGPLEDGLTNSSTSNIPSYQSEFKGASNTQELHVMLTSTLMIRRLKKDILQSLPCKEREIIRIKVQDESKREKLKSLLSQIRSKSSNSNSNNGIGDGVDATPKKMKKTYTTSTATATVSNVATVTNSGSDVTDISTNTNNKLNEKKESMSLLLQLFTQSGEAKLPAVLEHLGKFLDNPNNGKILVFAHHRIVMDTIATFIEKRNIDLVRIDGQTSGKDRYENTKYFQSVSKCRVALLAITAAGISITLTAASTVYFAEMFWTPGSIIQAEDRAHRIGQRNTVVVKYFLAENTVDDVLWPLFMNKVKILGEVVEGNGSTEFNVIDSDSVSATATGTGTGTGTDTTSSKSKKRGATDKSSDDTFGNEVYDLTKDLAFQELSTVAKTLSVDDQDDDADVDVDTVANTINDISDSNDIQSVSLSKEPDDFAKMHMNNANTKLNNKAFPLDTAGKQLNALSLLASASGSASNDTQVVELHNDNNVDEYDSNINDAETNAIKVIDQLISEGKITKTTYNLIVKEINS